MLPKYQPIYLRNVQLLYNCPTPLNIQLLTFIEINLFPEDIVLNRYRLTALEIFDLICVTLKNISNIDDQLAYNISSVQLYEHLTNIKNFTYNKEMSTITTLNLTSKKNNKKEK